MKKKNAKEAAEAKTKSEDAEAAEAKTKSENANESRSESKTQNNWIKDLIVGILVVAILVYVYIRVRSFVHHRNLKNAMIEPPLSRTPPPESPRPPTIVPPTIVPNTVSQNQSQQRPEPYKPANGAVLATPVASSSQGSAPASLDKAAEYSEYACLSACIGFNHGKGGHLIANIAPMVAKAVPSCQCFRIATPATRVEVAFSAPNSMMLHDSKLTNLANSSATTHPAFVREFAEPSQTSLSCKTADITRDGYHEYNAPTPLLSTRVHLWYDAASKTVKYARAGYLRDTGNVSHGYPNKRVAKLLAMFQPGDELEADMALGIVYKKNEKPVVHDTNGAEAADAAAAAGASNSTERLQVGSKFIDRTALFAASKIIDRQTGLQVTGVTDTTTILLKEKPANFYDGLCGGLPDEAIGFMHRGKKYRFINRAAGCGPGDIPVVPIYQLAILQGVNPHGQYMTLFDYAHLSTESDLSLTLRATVPEGTMTIDDARGTARFVPTTPRKFHTFFLNNNATPARCISCKFREESVCGHGTVLIGCGLKQLGFCGTCYMTSLDSRTDDQPCGNCQIGRLHVMTDSGKTWTDANQPILLAAHKDDKEYIAKKYEGPFVTKTHAQSKAGLHSIEDAMKFDFVKNRFRAAAAATGRTAAGATPTFCKLADTVGYASRKGPMHVDQDIIRNDAFRNNYYTISTLVGRSYGDAVCQLGTTQRNGFDGGFCVLGFADLQLFTTNGGKGPKTGDLRLATVRRRYGGKDQLKTMGGAQALQETAFSSNFSPTLKWTIQPRVHFPRSVPFPKFNIYAGVILPIFDLTVRIFNNESAQGTPAPNVTAYNDDDAKAHYVDVKQNDTRSVGLYKNTKAIRLPPYSDVAFTGTLRGGGPGTLVYTNATPALVYPPLLSVFKGGTVTNIAPANKLDESLKMEDIDVIKKAKEEQRYHSDLLVTTKPSEASEDEHLVPHSLRSNPFYGYQSCIKLPRTERTIAKSLDNSILIPRAAAECRVMGYGFRSWRRFCGGENDCGSEGYVPYINDHKLITRYGHQKGLDRQCRDSWDLRVSCYEKELDKRDLRVWNGGAQSVAPPTRMQPG